MLIKFHNNQLPAPCVSIASTTIEMLQWTQTKNGIGTITHKKKYNLDKHKDCYTYVVKYDNEINLLKNIEPYLIIETKRKRTRLIINEYKNKTVP